MTFVTAKRYTLKAQHVPPKKLKGTLENRWLGETVHGPYFLSLLLFSLNNKNESPTSLFFLQFWVNEW